MDIDTRRSLGIFGKLEVPESLQSHCFHRIDSDKCGENTSYIITLSFDGYTSQYNPMKCYYDIIRTFTPRGVVYEIKHYLRVVSKYTTKQRLASMQNILDGGEGLLDNSEKAEDVYEHYEY